MKFARLIDDFQVTERSDFKADGGPFALYELTKRGIGTLEAIAALSNRWRIPRERISFGGLKDRHAVTRQFITIHRGPQRNFAQSSFEVRYLGQAAEAFTSRHIAGNRFHLVLRDLSDAEVHFARQALDEVAADGLPNYFDDQRFGSVGESGRFIAEPWCAGDYERALWLALAEPNRHDRPQDRERRQVLREHWGQWTKCLELLPRSTERDVAEFLARRPGDYRRAMARLPQELRSLYLAAYQSHLWNALLTVLLRESCRADQLLQRRRETGTILFPRNLEPEQRKRLAETVLPLPSARTRIEEPTLAEFVNRVLEEQDISLRQLRVKYPRDSFFSKGDRAVMVFPKEARCSSKADDLHPECQLLQLDFELPRAAYATILVKRITAD